MNQQQPSSSRSAPGGVWNGNPIPGMANRGRVSRHPPPPPENESDEEKKLKVEYTCKLPHSYGQSTGVYEKKPGWVEDAPPAATVVDDDDDWSDPVDPAEKERLLKAAQKPFCPLVKAGPNVNFFLYPGEKMEQCPYDKGHQILEARFLGHLEKCRQNYIKQQKARGKRLEIDVCLHDRRHHIRVDEMEEHAAVCPATLKYQKEAEEINNAPPPTFPQYNPPPVARMVPQNPTGHSPDKGTKGAEQEEENWELAEPVPSFNPVENLAQRGTQFFCPQGLTKSERKDFRENERIRSYLMEQRDKLKRESSRGQGPAGQGADPNGNLLAKLEEEIQERAEKFKNYVYRTRPSADWMDEDKDDEYE